MRVSFADEMSVGGQVNFCALCPCVPPAPLFTAANDNATGTHGQPVLSPLGSFTTPTVHTVDIYQSSVTAALIAFLIDWKKDTYAVYPLQS